MKIREKRKGIELERAYDGSGRLMGKLTLNEFVPLTFPSVTYSLQVHSKIMSFISREQKKHSRLHGA